MIISASRRTDIPTYYSDWFFNRIKEGYVYVRNPMNIHQISKISLSPEVVDGIVFWTKNPIPMMDRIDEISDYSYYFQFTLNSYGNEIESNVPNKNDIIIPAFKNLSRKIGAHKVLWRYDPIFITDKYSVDYHVTYFSEIAKRLSGYTEKCIISFLDLYKNTQNSLKDLKLVPIEQELMYELAERIVEIANNNHIVVESCAEKVSLEHFGIKHGHCIDCALFERIIGQKLKIDKDKNQRAECGCVASIDIGGYNTCKNGCKYCYANYSNKTVEKNFNMHNPTSPLLFGEVGSDDVIKEREVKSFKDNQLTLFDDN